MVRRLPCYNFSSLHSQSLSRQCNGLAVALRIATECQLLFTSHSSAVYRILGYVLPMMHVLYYSCYSQWHGRSKLLGWSGFGPTTFLQTQLVHAHFKLRTVEDSSYNRVFLEKLIKTMLLQYFVQSTTNLVYSVLVPHSCYAEPQQKFITYTAGQRVFIWLQHIHAQVITITRSLSMWLSI